MEHMIEVRCIRHIYPDKTEVSLCGMDFIVDEGERVVLLGPNGAGKTTLLSHILGLLVPVEGTVQVMGLNPNKDFHTMRKSLGVVFQNVDEQIIGPLVYDDIAFGLRNEGVKEPELRERVHAIADWLGITPILQKIPHYLSGGQKKKVALAGAIIHQPRLLVLDEPFDGLDPKSKAEMIQILNRLNREQGTTLVLTTHDINIVPSIADIIYVIHDSHIAMRGCPQEVFMQMDLLKEANLEPPILMELFIRFKDRGLPLSIPNNVEDAEEQILKLLERGDKRSLRD
ncbi:MAG: energy-coupling factor ABC transporter ATP-binding protein [Clostridia bacterium]